MTVREETLLTVWHPEFIGNDWQRVDHPVLAPLHNGAPDLGWEGDQRLVVYLHKPSQTFVLWRLEADGQYSPCMNLPYTLSPQAVNETIRRLIDHDTRRGFDAYQSIIDAQELADRHREQDRMDAIVQFADKLHYGLSRSHLPGVWATRVRNVTSRR